MQSLVRAQTRQVNSLFSEAEKLLREGEETGDSGQEYTAGVKFLQVQRGAPKHNKLMKLKKETGIVRLIERVENDYLREKKMHILDEDLLYVIDEKANTVDLQESGRTNLSPNDPELFVLPALSEAMSELEGRAERGEISGERAEHEREKIHREYADKSERLHNIHQLLKAYALFEVDVDYVVQDGQVIRLLLEIPERVAHDGNTVKKPVFKPELSRVPLPEIHRQLLLPGPLAGQPDQIAGAVNPGNIQEFSSGQFQAVPPLTAAEVKNIVIFLQAGNPDNQVHVRPGILLVLDHIPVGFNVSGVE